MSEVLLAAGREMGYSAGKDLNGESQLGFTLAQACHVNGSRLSSYKAYIAPLIGNLDNIIVSPNSLVSSSFMSSFIKLSHTGKRRKFE